MRVYLVYRNEDREFGETVAREMGKRQFDSVEDPASADLALLLVTSAALRHGLGDHARQALEGGLDVRTVLVGDDTLPLRFPVHRKHAPVARDVAGVLKVLAEHRKGMATKTIDSKSDLFGYGVLLGLLHRS